MRFLVDNAAKYHIDTKWLFIGGGSGEVADLAYFYANLQSDRISPWLPVG